MTYFYITADEEREMLEAIGAASVQQLFACIPEHLRLDRPLDLPPALGELELTQHMQQLAEQNLHAERSACFLGAGTYDHFIPAVVDHLAGRGEFYTSYTPYQPEVSQGNLQVMFEYQTLICRLTGMDVSNASLYDGASAAAEAALMCLSMTRRYGKVIVPSNLHPHYRRVLATYLEHLEPELVTIAHRGGRWDTQALQHQLDDHTACVFVQQPNVFGCLEDLEQLAGQVHARGALLVACVDPISLGLLKRPGDVGADVVVAEGQSLGNPMSFGGPQLGILACRAEGMRRMPGRVAGQTVDRRGRRCWVLTLQTREQHIRREKATSNICTNQGLLALRAAVYLAAMGPRGLRRAAELSAQKAHYAARQLVERSGWQLAFDQPFFKEFVVRDPQRKVQQRLAAASEQDVLAGIPLGHWYPDLDDCLLVAVTERRTRAEIDRWVELLGSHSPA